MTAAAAVPLVIGAGKAAQHTISEALTADLAVIRWQGRTPRKRKGIARQPVEYEVHVNPAAIGVGAVGVAAALWLLDDKTRKNAGGTVGETWWDVQKYGSPLGLSIDTFGLSPVGHAVAAWNAVVGALFGK